MSDYIKDPLALAVLFHALYEKLAPDSGYETRKETRIFDPESPNGQLMIRVCGEVQSVLREDMHTARQWRTGDPAESGWYLVTVRSDSYLFVRRVLWAEGWLTPDGDTMEKMGWTVLAWMPPPEPWKEGE